jgi:hypothetical protein
MEHDIGKLRKRLQDVDKKRASLVSLHDQLWPIIQRPGWTTIAELELVMLAIDSLDHHVDTISNTQNKLIDIATHVNPTIKPPVGDR